MRTLIMAATATAIVATAAYGQQKVPTEAMSAKLLGLYVIDDEGKQFGRAMGRGFGADART